MSDQTSHPTRRQRTLATRPERPRLRARFVRPPEQEEAPPVIEPAPPAAEVAPLVIGADVAGLVEDSTGEHEVPAEVAALHAAFEQPDTAPGAPLPPEAAQADEAAAPKESWRAALEAAEQDDIPPVYRRPTEEEIERTIHDRLSFSDMSGAEIGKRHKPEEPLTYEQIDAIIQRTARIYQKRPEELGAASIQQLAQREFQLGPADIEQVIDALGIYQREAKARGRRERMKLAGKYAAAVLALGAIAGGALRGKTHMERKYNTVATQQYFVILAMQERRAAILTYGLKAEQEPGKSALKDTKEQLTTLLKRYDETATSYNDQAQSAPLSWVVWFFELPDSVPTSRDFTGLYTMGL